MQKLFFTGQRPYCAHIGRGALSVLGSELASCITGEKAVIVTDSGVPLQHVRAVKEIASETGFFVTVAALQAGESSKTLSAMHEVYGAFYRAGVTRSDGVIALGGGVVGDIAGFAAATYLRGVPYVCVPTTIIAQTDSAYGGKTGVDFLQGKNHIGCFYDPASVVCETSFLHTLSNEQRLCGMGEVIKYGAIASEALLDIITASGRALPDEDVITQCVSIKRDLVRDDEHDSGKRRILNFGHTLGHAIEASSGYTVHHGQAVMYGMLAAAALGQRLGVTEPEAAPLLEQAAEAVGLSTDWRPHSASALPLITRDKKADGTAVDFVLLKKIGSPVRKKLTFEEIKNGLKA